MIVINQYSNSRAIGALLCALIALFPIDQLFTSIFNISSNLSPLRIISFGCLLLLINIKGYAYTSVSKDFYKLSLVFIIYLFFSSTWAIVSITDGIFYVLKILVLWGTSLVLVVYLRTVENIIGKICFPSVIVGSIVALLSLMGLITAGEIGADQRLRFENIGVNALAISIGYVYCLGVGYLSSESAKLYERVLIWIALPILLMFMLKTGTRSVIWGCLIIIMPAYLIAYRRVSIKFVAGTLVAVCIGILVIAYAEKNHIIGGKLFDRIATANSEVVGENTRIELWTKGVVWLSDNLLGSGPGNEMHVFKSFSNYREDSLEAHNTFISTLLQANLMGFLLFMLLIILLIKRVFCIEDKDVKFMALLLLFFFMLQLVKGSILQTRLFWHPITLILLFSEATHLHSLIRNMKVSKKLA